ncbi:MAG: PilZ domain-containing protein [Candidatus Aminicenantes bacterium]|nr:PilZ domain-containing protein [Candidatus Aminicenantes bacterium]
MSYESSDNFNVNTALKEQGFNLSLPTLIEGQEESGKDFKEKTVLSYISHHGSSFWLTNPVALGSELKLIIDLPPKLADRKDLKLVIKGKVIFVEVLKGKSSKQRVSLKFSSKYIIDSQK